MTPAKPGVRPSPQGASRSGALSRPTLAAALLLATACWPCPGRGGDVKVVERPGCKPPPADYHAKYAIIVGIDDYSKGEGFAQLQNADNDVREFRKLLVEEFGYDDAADPLPDRRRGASRGIVDGRPTRQAIRDAFERWLPGRGLGPDDSVLFFFAGHGLRDGGSGEATSRRPTRRPRDPRHLHPDRLDPPAAGRHGGREVPAQAAAAGLLLLGGPVLASINRWWLQFASAGRGAGRERRSSRGSVGDGPRESSGVEAWRSRDSLLTSLETLTSA